MPRLWSQMERFGQLALAVLAGTVLVGPALAVFAASKPAVALAMKPAHAVIAVHPFLDLGTGSCFDDPPVHLGPFQWSGRHFEYGVASRMDQPAFQCLRRGTDDHFVLTVSLGAKGRIETVETDDDPDSALTACAESVIRGGTEPLGRGPLRMKIGYYMGRDR